MNNELKTEKLDFTSRFVINLDFAEVIIVKINGKEIKLDKEKLEKFLSNFCEVE